MSMSKLWARSLAVLAVLLVVTLGASAQYRGSIQGVVTDPQGAIVSGAKVTLTNLETNQSQTVDTNDLGIFNFNGLPPSRFSISVEKQGFKKKVLENVGVLADQANALNVQLDLGQTSEQIVVSGDSTPLIDTETASNSGSVQSRQIQALPSIGRDPFQLLQLAPGAFGDGAQSAGGGTSNLPGTTIGGTGASDGIFKTENGGQISANGARTGENNYTIDGVGMTSVSWGGTAVVTPNEDSIKEVKVITDNYDAEYGRYRGAQVQIISQNGTNNYHGSFYFKAHRPGLDAYQKWNGPFNAVQRDSNRFNDWGGSVGGPVLKNRLFLFFSYETISNNAASGTTDGWYETPDYRALAVAGTNAAAITGYPGAGPNGGTQVDHPCSDINLVQNVNCFEIPGKGLNLGRPLNSSFASGTRDPSWQFVSGCGDPSKGQPLCMPGLGGDGTGNSSNLDPTTATIAFYQGIPNPQSSNEKQYNGRVDFNLTSRDLIAFSIYYVPVSSTSINGSGDRLMNKFNHQVLNEAFTGLWDHTFSTTIVNEARFNAAGWRWKDLQLNPNGPWGLAPVNFDNPFSGASIGTLSSQGFGIGAPGTFDQWTYGAKDVLTKVHGSHTIKLGGEVTRLLFVDNSPWNARPTYWFNNYWDFLNEAPVGEQATFNPVTGVPTDFRKDTRSTLYGLFVQDNYKLRPNLTITLGLRWEYFGPISEKNGNLATVELGSGPSTFTNIKVRKGGNLYSPQDSNFGPQIGFAWSPRQLFGRDYGNRLVFRGGFGIAYNGLDEAISLNGRSNPPFVSATGVLSNSPNCGTSGNPICQILYTGSFPSDVHSFTGYASNPAAIASFDPATNLPVPGTANFAPAALTGYPASWPSTSTYHYTLQGEYDLGHEWVASLGYQGSQTRHLTQQYNLYVVGATLGYALNPVVPGIDWYANDGNAHFNALLAEIHHRFSKTFELDTQYRLAKSVDTASNNYQNGQYQYNIASNLGPSDYDVRHAVKVWGVWAPRIFQGSNSYLEKIVGGWSISGIANWHTGFPWTPIYYVPDALFSGSSGYGGSNQLRPAVYNGGAGSSYSNSTFMKKNGNFPGGGSVYFVQPNVVAGPAFDCVVATQVTAECPSGRVPFGPVPTAPGVGRNSFRGPRYFDIDATLSKSFGLPKLPILGENAKFEFRTNFYNLFNKLNLTSVNANVSDNYFGTAMGALGGRVIEMQARFSF